MSLMDAVAAAPEAKETVIAGAPAEGAAPAAETPATPAAEGSPAAPEAPVVDSGDWYYDDNIKGEGSRPDWLKPKYKSAADQAKAYVEVEKKLGAFKGAPEEYDLALPDHPDIVFRKDDPVLGEFLENAKKNGVSQEYVSELLGTYAHAMTMHLPNPDAEMKKLGARASEEIQILGQWASSNLTPSEFETFKRMTTTAESVRLFEKMRRIATSADVAQPGSVHVHRETEEQVRKLVSDPRYDTDPNFRAEVKRRMSAALGVK